MNTEYLIDMQEEIKEQKEELIKTTGMYEQLMSTLKRKHKCNTIKQAKKKLKSKKAQIKKDQIKLKKIIEKIQKQYEL